MRNDRAQNHFEGATPESVDVFGIPIAPLRLSELLNIIHVQIIRSPSDHADPFLISYVNAHSCNLFEQNMSYQLAMLEMDLIYADGNGPRLAAWLNRDYLPPRMTAADWIDDLCNLCEEHEHSMFLLGGIPGVAQAASYMLIKRHPRLKIVGTHHGYFSQDEESKIVRSIQRMKPGLLILGIGNPLQEMLMLRLKEELSVPVIWGAGGLLDYVSGKTPRAPRWMRRLALEWLGRMLIEPIRLIPRYLLGIPRFMVRSIQHALHKRLLHRNRNTGTDLPL